MCVEANGVTCFWKDSPEILSDPLKQAIHLSHTPMTYLTPAECINALNKSTPDLLHISVSSSIRIKLHSQANSSNGDHRFLRAIYSYKCLLGTFKSSLVINKRRHHLHRVGNLKRESTMAFHTNHLSWDVSAPHSPNRRLKIARRNQR